MLNQSTTDFLSLCSIRLFYSGTRSVSGLFQTLSQQIITLFISSSSALPISMLFMGVSFSFDPLAVQAVTKSETGTWDLGTWDSTTWGDAGTQGCGDSGTR